MGPDPARRGRVPGSGRLPLVRQRKYRGMSSHDHDPLLTEEKAGGRVPAQRTRAVKQGAAAAERTTRRTPATATADAPAAKPTATAATAKAPVKAKPATAKAVPAKAVPAK